jgi:hypothetical protein
MNPILSGPVPELMHYLSVRNRSYPTRHRSVYVLCPNSPGHIRPDAGAYASPSGMDPIIYIRFDNLFRNGPDPIRSDVEAYSSSIGMDPILPEPIPELLPLLPEWIRPDPIPYRSLHLLFRNGPDPIRPYTEALTLSSGADPILSDPKPELIHLLPECIRSYPMRYRSLYIASGSH